MIYPKQFNEIARQAAAEFPGDAVAATKTATQRIQALPIYAEFINALVQTAIGDLVSAARHKHNTAIKAEAGEYGGPAKVVMGNSEALRNVMESYHSYAIAGTMLGCLYGRDLEGLASDEANKAEGHRFNERLLRRLRPFVPPDCQVQEVVTNERLRQIFKDVQKEAQR